MLRRQFVETPQFPRPGCRGRGGHDDHGPGRPGRHHRDRGRPRRTGRRRWSRRRSRAGRAAVAGREDRPTRRHRGHPVRPRHPRLLGGAPGAVLRGDPGQRDEVAGRRAGAGRLRLVRRRPPGRLRRRRTASWCAATRCAGTTSCPTGSPPAWRTGASAPRSCGPCSAARVHRGHPLPRPDLAVGRRQRVLPRRGPVRPGPEQLLDHQPRPGRHPDAFRWAHEADPGALLFYNDYNIGGEDGTNAKSDAVYAWLQQMLARACRSTASATRATSTPSTAGTRSCCSRTWSGTRASASRWPSPRRTCAPSSTGRPTRCRPTTWPCSRTRTSSRR